MAKSSIKIARRYARALIGLYQVSELESVKESLNQLSGIWQENAELREALENPALNLNERMDAAAQIASRVRPSDQSFSNLVKILLERRRMPDLPQIAASFSDMVAGIKNLLSLKVTSAFPIAQDESEEFQKHLEKEFGSLASVEWNVDKELIGGLRVKAGDRLLDGSLRGSLEKLQTTLMA